MHNTEILWLNKEKDTTSQSGKKWYSGMKLKYFDPSKPSIIHISGCNGSIVISSHKTEANENFSPDWNVGRFSYKSLMPCHNNGNDFTILTGTYATLLDIANKTMYNNSISNMFVDIYNLNESMEVRLTNHSVDGKIKMSATTKLTKFGFQHIKQVQLLYH